MSGSHGHLNEHEWDALERYFVEETSPGVTYRDFADKYTERLAITNYTHINYNDIKDHGKAHHWMEKRARFQMESNPTLYTDMEVMYGLIKESLVSDADVVGEDKMTVGERRHMLAEMRAYAEMLMATRQDPIIAGAEQQKITRDDVLSLAEDCILIDMKDILLHAQVVHLEETPV